MACKSAAPNETSLRKQVGKGLVKTGPAPPAAALPAGPCQMGNAPWTGKIVDAPPLFLDKVEA
jgi:hypothetical protein